MLQSVRDNMKGGLVATIVILFFVVPLVLTGVGDGSFLGSAAGTDAAEVDGKSISVRELRQAMETRKSQLLNQQGVEPDAEFLKDENLRGPVLDNLVRRAALVVASRDAGAEIADQIIDGQIGQFEVFQVDGKFDKQAYRNALASRGYTSTGFRNMLAEDLLVRQHNEAIELSSFYTDKELDILISLIQQKRSFFTVEIPKDKVKDSIEVTDEEIQAYYEENKSNYSEPEKLSVNYVQLSIDELAKDVDVTEEDIKAQYEAERANFEKNVEYDIAHILIEEKDGQEAIVQELQAKLDAGEDFAKLAAEYSDDSGTKENAGKLGVMLPGTFAEEFESAVYALDEGQVSSPVQSDAGIHFIKVLAKNEEQPPSYEDRREAIAAALKKAEAEQRYVLLVDQLGELAFSGDLKNVAEELELEFKTTEPFTRTSGSGIAANASVRDVAFGDEVLKEGYNSKVVEMSTGNSVVVHKAEHIPARIKPLEEVKELISSTLLDKKTSEKLELLATEAIEKIKSGEVTAEEFAKANEYEYKSFDKAKRAGASADYQVISKVFSLSGDEETVFDTVANTKGNQVVVGLTEVVPGSREDMPEQQLQALTSQLKVQNGRFESNAFEEQILAEADVEIY